MSKSTAPVEAAALPPSAAGEPPRWSTASFGEPAHTSPMELRALGSHLSACAGAAGPLLALRCAGEALRGFVAPRLVSTVVLLALGSTVVTLWP